MFRAAMIVLGGLVMTVLACGRAAGDADPVPLPKVRLERPRIFLRRQAWNGPSVERIKTWLDRPEYKAHLAKVDRALAQEGGSKNMNLVMKYLFQGDTDAGKQCLDRYINQRSGGTSPSYWGIKDQCMAACYDWLYDHPAFTPEMKKNRMEYLELRCRANLSYLRDEPENPFYSRFPGALAGLTACALAIYGDHPKAEEYLRFAFDCFREKMNTIRKAEDGSTGGASYGYHHEFTDLANLVACWRSATDFDAAQWIRQSQGDWLYRQMLFQIWMTYPNGRFVKDGDIWGRDTADDRQVRMQIDAITGMYQSGIGRAYADLMYKRWGVDDYHSEYIWEFFVFNDPDVKPEPLSDLGRAAVFGPKYQGMVAWRSDWTDSAAVVHFRAGESGDTHSTWDQGKFMIFKERPLAIKNGAYIKFMDAHHRYYKSPWSANCVLFESRTETGTEPVLRSFPAFRFRRADWWPKGLFGWDEWVALREKHSPCEVMGTLLEAEQNDQHARAAADLSYRLKQGSGVTPVWDWTREIVFLGYRYVIVLDRVKTYRDAQGRPIGHKWTLHTTYEPKVDGTLAVADNGPARLFCRTLLPEAATLTKVGGPGHECDFAGENPLPPGMTALDPSKLGPSTQMGAWRLDIAPDAPRSECVYLHVLYPTDVKMAGMPACSVKEVGADVVVHVGDLTYTFTRPAGARSQGN